MKIIAVDIGGTSLKSGLLIDKEIIETNQIFCDGKISFAANKDALLRSIKYFIDRYQDIHGIAISSAGNIDPINGTCVFASDNLKGYTGFHIKKYIEDNFKLETRVNNDCVCHLIAELTPEDIDKTIFMMTLGTGVGACIFKNGHIQYGNNFDLGKLQHFILKENGIPCDCGLNGCAEREISATGLIQSIKENFKEDISPKELFDRYSKKDHTAIKVINEYIEKMNKFLTFLIDVHHVDIIYIGGGVANSIPLILPKLVHNDKIRLAKGKNVSGLIGAYKLFEV